MDGSLLDQAMVDALESRFNGENGMADWDDLASNDRHSCDMVLDTDDDGLANFEEEVFDQPDGQDSDMDSSTTSSRWPTQPSPSTPAWVNPATNRFSSPRHAPDRSTAWSAAGS